VNLTEVDATTLLLDEGASLGVFLFQHDPEGRLKSEAALYKQGAQFVAYPGGSVPRIKGIAFVDGPTLTVFVDPLYVVCPLGVPAHAMQSVRRVALFLLREPFEADGGIEKNVLAASMPLDILEREARE